MKAFAVTKTSAALWLGKVGNDELQRVYGITFPDKNEFKEWKHFQEEAAKRDHRVIGLNQELFFFDDLSPGSCFFQVPRGHHARRADTTRATWTLPSHLLLKPRDRPRSRSVGVSTAD